MAIDTLARGLAASKGGGGGGGADVTQGVGIQITGVDLKTISNAGVTDIKSSDEDYENGTIKVVIAGSEAKSKPIKVKGLDDAAYKKVDTEINDETKDSENVVTTKAVVAKLNEKLDASKWVVATDTEPGLFAPEDKTKLDKVEVTTEQNLQLEIDAMFSGFNLPPLDPSDNDGIADQEDIEVIFDDETVPPESSDAKTQGNITTLDTSEIDDILNW